MNFERLRRYAVQKLESVADRPFVLLYVHSQVSYMENCPGVLWLRSLHNSLSAQCTKNMASLAILHCSWSLWMLMMTLCPAALYAKVEYYSRIEFLEEELQGTLELPSFVLEHDKLLEDQPLADYGIFATKEQIAQVGLNSSGG
mmetsp:Transcript_34022/g.96383  ORF Transcript_34022/g.96383 Transcript_34022/m.96383 type:complete len:144 (-) Transcript_34022:192-623(-)